jgi:tRNA 5-methylaminomethyl-2-thiouridine biosynthesis bifunctional protein
VLCNAQACADLLETLPPERAVEPVPLAAVRGQITEWPLTGEEAEGDVTVPRLAVAGSGYVLPLSARTLLCGATSDRDDPDPEVRDADHRHNLAQAVRLGACKNLAPDEPLPSGLTGRTAWRAMTPDRLPLIGALPLSMGRLATHAGKRKDQIRLIPRERNRRGGLYVLSGLGSRGITWSCLAGELLAHWVTGTPCPIEADLRDALDPARFLVRRMTKGPSHPHAQQTDAEQD